MSIHNPINHRKVVVTGLGVISPLGNDVLSTWERILSGASAVGEITAFDARTFTTRIAAEVKQFLPRSSWKGKHHRMLSPLTQFALEAATQALEDAGIMPTKTTNHRWGVVTGSGMMTAEFEYLQRFQKTCATEGTIDWAELEANSQSFYKLLDFGKSTACTGLSTLIQSFDIAGYASSVHTACASGGQALGLALQVIRRGEADYMLAGGYDSMISPLGLSSFCLLGALSTYNDTPETASRPFDKTRNGFVLGEGAAFLVLESLEHAKARGAKIYAEFAGEGNSLSAYRITDSHPNGDGAVQAMQWALRDAQLEANDVDYMNAHGTSTQMNDLSETNAIKVVYAERAHVVPVSSTKSQTGHLIAAAGALEAIFSVLSIHTGVIPMTANLLIPDPQCDLDYVVDGPREKSVGVVMSNSFGFGGSNSSLIFTHPDFYQRTAHE